MNKSVFIFVLIFLTSFTIFDFFNLKRFFVVDGKGLSSGVIISLPQNNNLQNQEKEKNLNFEFKEVDEDFVQILPVVKPKLYSSFEEEEKLWYWISTTYRNGKTIKPNEENIFAISFGEDIFTTKTDCNEINGRYFYSKNRISFIEIISTKKICKNSNENDFKKILENAGKYYFTDLGELVLVFKDESGVALFK